MPDPFLYLPHHVSLWSIVVAHADVHTIANTWVRVSRSWGHVCRPLLQPQEDTTIPVHKRRLMCIKEWVSGRMVPSAFRHVETGSQWIELQQFTHLEELDVKEGIGNLGMMSLELLIKQCSGSRCNIRTLIIEPSSWCYSSWTPTDDKQIDCPLVWPALEHLTLKNCTEECFESPAAWAILRRATWVDLQFYKKPSGKLLQRLNELSHLTRIGVWFKDTTCYYSSVDTRSEEWKGCDAMTLGHLSQFPHLERVDSTVYVELDQLTTYDDMVVLPGVAELSIILRGVTTGCKHYETAQNACQHIVRQFPKLARLVLAVEPSPTESPTCYDDNEVCMGDEDAIIAPIAIADPIIQNPTVEWMHPLIALAPSLRVVSLTSPDATPLLGATISAWRHVVHLTLEIGHWKQDTLDAVVEAAATTMSHLLHLVLTHSSEFVYVDEQGRTMSGLQAHVTVARQLTHPLRFSSLTYLGLPFTACALKPGQDESGFCFRANKDDDHDIELIRRECLNDSSVWRCIVGRVNAPNLKWSDATSNAWFTDIPMHDMISWLCYVEPRHQMYALPQEHSTCWLTQKVVDCADKDEKSRRAIWSLQIDVSVTSTTPSVDELLSKQYMTSPGEKIDVAEEASSWWFVHLVIRTNDWSQCWSDRTVGHISLVLYNVPFDANALTPLVRGVVGEALATNPYMCILAAGKLGLVSPTVVRHLVSRMSGHESISYEPLVTRRMLLVRNPYQTQMYCACFTLDSGRLQAEYQPEKLAPFAFGDAPSKPEVKSTTDHACETISVLEEVVDLFDTRAVDQVASKEQEQPQPPALWTSVPQGFPDFLLPLFAVQDPEIVRRAMTYVHNLNTFNHE